VGLGSEYEFSAKEPHVSKKTQSKKLRFGVVGMGFIGRIHAKAIVAGRETALGAVADAFAPSARKAGEEFNVPPFSDPQTMFESGLIDAVIIATPHYLHPPLTIRAARCGLHVLCEKPMAVTIGAARAMVDECRKRKVALGSMLQMRTRGIMRKMKRLVDSGSLGRILRVSMICTNWYRTQAYYDSGTWRGTWEGEGGGILLNQAPHNLDLFQWIGGMPKAVSAITTTRVHKIEVENTANLIFDYGNGCMGSFYATTAELPGQDQFLIAGDKATLLAEGKSLRIARLSRPLSKHAFECKEAGADNGGPPSCTWSDVEYKEICSDNRAETIRAFAAHVLHGKEMVASGADGLAELEISNAAYVSADQGRRIDLPVDAAVVDKLLDRLARSSARKMDPAKSLRRQAAKDLRKLLRS